MSSVVISGDTSGSVTLQAPAVAGTTVLTLPATSGTVLTTASGQWITTGSNIYYNTGNVGIGTSSPTSKLHVASADYPGAGVYRALDVTVVGAASQRFEIGALSGSTYIPGGAIDGQLDNPSTTGLLSFSTRSSNTLTERMRIASAGNVLINTTTATESGRFITAYNGAAEPGIVVVDSSATATVNMMFFYKNGAVRGSIQSTATATAYNTSSDYRLKENIAPMTGALDKVTQLKPVTFTWKETGEDSQGFIAHELQAIVPDCVYGEKDAVDEEGKPIHQGVDTSFLVATLTAAIQEQQTIINDLKARVEALENK
jgi:hypothetical protein